MKIKLVSDFIDSYDHWFCSSYETPDFVFKRNSTNDFSRSSMFLLFKKLKLTAPLWGTVENELCFYMWKHQIKDVVIYLNEFSHQGKDKIKLSFEDASKVYKGYLCSQYIIPDEGSTSFRYLKIGSRSFWLKYQSDHDWLSNNGNVTVKTITELREPFFNFNLNHPIYSIDFIVSDSIMYAIDFNTSPGLKNTGIDKFIPNKEIYKEIENYYTLSSHSMESTI